MLDLEFLKVIEYDIESVNGGFLCNRLEGKDTIVIFVKTGTYYVVANIVTKTMAHGTFSI